MRDDVIKLPWRAASFGVRVSVSSARWTERLVLGALRGGMDAVAELSRDTADGAGQSAAARDSAPPSREMETLLARSLRRPSGMR